MLDLGPFIYLFLSSLKKYNFSLSSVEVSSCLQVRPEEVTASLPELVSCVGCRRSVEAVFQSLRTSAAGDKALEPLTVSSQGIVTVNRCGRGLRMSDMRQILCVLFSGST